MSEPQRDIFAARRKLLETDKREQLIELQARSEDEAAKVQLQQQIDYLEPRGFSEGYFKTAEGTERTAADFLPFANAAAQAARLERLEAAMDRLSRDEGKEDDEDIVQAFWDEQVRPASWTYTAGRIAADAVPFALEFMATKKLSSGLFAGMAAGGRLTGRAGALMGRMATPYQRYAKYTKQLASRRPILGNIARAATFEAPEQLIGQTVVGEMLGGSRLRASQYANYIGNRYGLDVKHDQGLSVRVADDTYGMWSNALPSAIFDNYVEMFSESIGEALVHLPAAMKLAGITKGGRKALEEAKQGIYNNPMLSFLGLVPDPKHVALWSDFGFQGLVPELGEELVGALIRDVTHQVMPELAEGGNTEHLIENLPAIALGMSIGMFGPAALHSGVNYTDVLLARAYATKTDTERLRELAGFFEDEEVRSKVGQRLVNLRLVAQRNDAMGSAELAVNETVTSAFLTSDKVRAEAERRLQERAARRGQPLEVTQADIEQETQTMLDELLSLPLESEDGESSPLLARLAELELLTPGLAEELQDNYERRVERLREALANGTLDEFIDEIGDDAAKATLAEAKARGIDVSTPQWQGAALAAREEAKARLRQAAKAEQDSEAKRVLRELGAKEALGEKGRQAAAQLANQEQDARRALFGAYMQLLEELRDSEPNALPDYDRADVGGVVGAWARKLGVVMLRVSESPGRPLGWRGQFVSSSGVIWINTTAVKREMAATGQTEQQVMRRVVLHELLHHFVRQLSADRRLEYLRKIEQWLDSVGVPTWDAKTEAWYKQLHATHGMGPEVLLEERVIHRLDQWAGLVEGGLSMDPKQRRGWRKAFFWLFDSLMDFIAPRTRMMRQVVALRGEIESYAADNGIDIGALSDRQVVMMAMTIDHMRQILSLEPESVDYVVNDLRKLEQTLRTASRYGWRESRAERAPQRERVAAPEEAVDEGEPDILPSEALEAEQQQLEAEAQLELEQLLQDTLEADAEEQQQPAPRPRQEIYEQPELPLEPAEAIDDVDNEQDGPSAAEVNKLRLEQLRQLLTELTDQPEFSGAAGSEREGKPARVATLRKAIKHLLGYKRLEGEELAAVSAEIGYDLTTRTSLVLTPPQQVEQQPLEVSQAARPMPTPAEQRAVTKVGDEPDPAKMSLEEVTAFLEEARGFATRPLAEVRELLQGASYAIGQARQATTELTRRGTPERAEYEYQLGGAVELLKRRRSELRRRKGAEDPEADSTTDWLVRSFAGQLQAGKPMQLPPPPDWPASTNADVIYAVREEAERLAKELVRVKDIALNTEITDAMRAAQPPLIETEHFKWLRTLTTAEKSDVVRRLQKAADPFERTRVLLDAMRTPGTLQDQLFSLDPYAPEPLGEREIGEAEDKMVVRRMQPIFRDGVTNEPLPPDFNPGLRMYDGIVTEAEAAYYESLVQAAIDPSLDYKNRMRGTSLDENTSRTNRRTQISFGAKYEYGLKPGSPPKGVYDDRVPVEPLPFFINDIIERLISSGVLLESERPNSALINVYPQGASSIPPHNDLRGDKTGHQFTAPITTIRFGADTAMTFGYVNSNGPNTTRKDRGQPGLTRHAVQLPRGSVAVMRGDSALRYNHSILREDTTGGTSFSITLRRVEWADDYKPAPANTPSIFDEIVNDRRVVQGAPPRRADYMDELERGITLTFVDHLKDEGVIDSELASELKDIRVVSGGQLGVDTWGLTAAASLGLKTSGVVPSGGYRGKDKPKISSEEKELLGYVEGNAKGFRARTITNAQMADGTVWFGVTDSPGGRLTLDVRTQVGKVRPIVNPTPAELATWMHLNNVKVLNIAGNRPESLANTQITQEYIQQHLEATMRFLRYLRNRKVKAPAAKPAKPVDTYRKGAAIQQYGNPFGAKLGSGVVAVAETTEDAVLKYAEWLTGGHPDVAAPRRAWVLSQIDSGALDNAQLGYTMNRQYGRTDAYASHAHVLAEFVRLRRGLAQAPAVVNRDGTAIDAVVQLSPEVRSVLQPQSQPNVNIWAGRNENALLSNLWLNSEPMVLDGREYRSVEHYYQTNKGGTFDERTYAKYAELNRAGGQVGPKLRGARVDPGVSEAVMRKALRARFLGDDNGNVDQAAVDALVQTGEATITHDSPSGRGDYWTDWLPRELMALRQEVRSVLQTQEQQAGPAPMRPQPLRVFAAPSARGPQLQRSPEEIAATRELRQRGAFLSGRGAAIPPTAEQLAAAAPSGPRLETRPQQRPVESTEYIPEIDPDTGMAVLDEAVQNLLRSDPVQGAVVLPSEYRYQVVRYDKEKYDLPFNEVDAGNIVQLELEPRPFKPSKKRSREEWGRKAALQEEDYEDVEATSYGWRIEATKFGRQAGEVVPGTSETVIPISRQQPLIPKAMARRFYYNEERQKQFEASQAGEQVQPLQVAVLAVANRAAQRAGIFDEPRAFRVGDVVEVKLVDGEGTFYVRFTNPNGSTYTEMVPHYDLYEPSSIVYVEDSKVGVWAVDGTYIEESGDQRITISGQYGSYYIDLLNTPLDEVSGRVELAMRRLVDRSVEMPTEYVASKRQDVIFASRGEANFLRPTDADDRIDQQELRELTADEQKQASRAYFFPALAEYLDLDPAVARALFTGSASGVQIKGSALNQAYRNARNLGGERVGDFDYKQFEAVVEAQVEMLFKPINAVLGQVYTEGTTAPLMRAIEADTLIQENAGNTFTDQQVADAKLRIALILDFGRSLNEARASASIDAGAAVMPLAVSSEAVNVELETEGRALRPVRPEEATEELQAADQPDVAEELKRDYLFKREARRLLREYEDAGVAPNLKVVQKAASRLMEHYMGTSVAPEEDAAEEEAEEVAEKAPADVTGDAITDAEWRSVLGRMYVNSLGLLQAPRGFLKRSTISDAEGPGTLAAYGNNAWWQRYQLLAFGPLADYEVGNNFSLLQALGIVATHAPRAVSEDEISDALMVPHGRELQKASALVRMVGIVSRTSSGPVVEMSLANSLQTSMPFPMLSAAKSDDLIDDVLPASWVDVPGIDVVAIGFALANDNYFEVDRLIAASQLDAKDKLAARREFRAWRTELEQSMQAAAKAGSQRHTQQMIRKRRQAYMRLREGDFFGQEQWARALDITLAVQRAQAARANIYGDLKVVSQANRIARTLENERAMRHPMDAQTFEKVTDALKRELQAIDVFLYELQGGRVEAARQALRQHHDAQHVLQFRARTYKTIANPSFLVEDATKAARDGTDLVVFQRDKLEINMVLDPFNVYDPFALTRREAGDAEGVMQSAIGRLRRNSIDGLKLALSVRHHELQSIVDKYDLRRPSQLMALEKELTAMLPEDATADQRGLLSGILKAIELETKDRTTVGDLYTATRKAMLQHLRDYVDISVFEGKVVYASRRSNRTIEVGYDIKPLTIGGKTRVANVYTLDFRGTFTRGSSLDLVRLIAKTAVDGHMKPELDHMERPVTVFSISQSDAFSGDVVLANRLRRRGIKPVRTGEYVVTAQELLQITMPEERKARAMLGTQQGPQLYSIDPFAPDGGGHAADLGVMGGIKPSQWGNGYLGAQSPSSWDAGNMPKGFANNWSANWFLHAFDDWVRDINRHSYEVNNQMAQFQAAVEQFVDEEGVRGFKKWTRMQDIREAMLYAINIKGWLTAGGQAKAKKLGVGRIATTFDEYVEIALEMAASTVEDEAAPGATPKQLARMKELLAIAKQIFDGKGRWAALGFGEYNDGLGLAEDIVFAAAQTTQLASDARLIQKTQDIYIQLAWVKDDKEGRFQPDQYGYQEIGAAGGPVRTDVGKRALERKLYGIVHGVAAGLKLQRPDAINAWHNSTKTVYEGIYNRNFIEAMKIVGVIKDMRGRGGVLAGHAALKVNKLQGYQAPEWIAKYLNSAMTQYGIRDIENGFYRGYMRLTIAAKHMMLMFGFFHHQAFMRSYLFTVRSQDTWGAGGLKGALSMIPAWALSYGYAAGMVSREKLERVASKFTPYAVGAKTAEGTEPRLHLLVEEGLTIQRGNEIIGNPAGALYDIEDEQEFDAWIKKTIEGVGKLGLGEAAQERAYDWIRNFRTAQKETAQWLFNSMGANLKAAAALSALAELEVQYAAEMRADPEGTLRRLAKMAADKVNGDFGGLNLRARGGKVTDLFGKGGPRDPRVQMALRALILAPDWTESNLYTVLAAMKREDISGSTEAMQRAKQNMFRHMWLRVGSRALAIQFMINLLLAGLDPDRDMYDMYEEAGFYGKKSDDTPSFLKFRWLDVNASMLSPTESKKFISIFGHFGDPLKWTADIINDGPLAPIDRKGSVAMRAIVEAITGSDYSGRRFTTLREILGMDYDAGEYQRKTTLADGTVKYAGESKAGKYAGRLSKFSVKTGPVELEQILGGGYLWTQVFKFTPLQVRGVVEYILGQKDGFDMLMELTGTKYGKTYVK